MVTQRASAETSALLRRTFTAKRAWVATAMAFVAVRALPVLTYPIGRDQGTYLMVGQRLLEGKQLYRDLWDNKPPGIFYLYALISKVFGTVMWSAAAVDILWLLVISYCIFRFAERYMGSAGAAIAVVVHASRHVQAGYVFTAQPETLQLLFIFIGFFVVTCSRQRTHWSLFVAGIVLGIACWFKYNALAFLPLLLVVPYLETSSLDVKPRHARLAIPWRRWLANAGFLLAGLVTVVILVLVYFWLSGAWPAMREVQFEVLPRYVALGFQNKTRYWHQVEIVTTYWVGTWTEVATLTGLVIAWRCRDLARFTPIFLAAGMAYASTAMQVRFHNYYFQTCFPFLAMIWGYVGVKIYEGCRAAARRCAARGWRWAAVLVWVVLANLVYLPLPEEAGQLTVEYRFLREWWRDRDSFYAEYPWQLRIEHLRDQLRVVRYLKQYSAPGDGVYVWGANALIYFLSDRRPPTRFVSNLGLLAVWAPSSWREELVQALQKSPPRFVVVARRDGLPSITYTVLDSNDYLQVFPRLNAIITYNYRLAADFDTFLVYRRVEPLPTDGRAHSEQRPRL